jgi:hypothetical protein
MTAEEKGILTPTASVPKGAASKVWCRPSSSNLHTRLLTSQQATPSNAAAQAEVEALKVRLCEHIRRQNGINVFLCSSLQEQLRMKDEALSAAQEQLRMQDEARQRATAERDGLAQQLREAREEVARLRAGPKNVE